MLRLTYLNTAASGISDLTGLECATNMQTLYLQSNKIIDISHLAGLTSLKTLWLGNNEISDISVLAGLTSLTNLMLSYNQISDITPLIDLTNLSLLWLPNNQISDISALSELTNIISLSLSFNKIKDISSLSNMTNLKTLYLDDNYVDDISTLTKMTKLERLYLYNNPLDMNAYITYIPLIYQNNPGISISYEYDPDPPETISASDGEFTDKIHISWDSVYSMNGDTLYQLYRSTSEKGSKTYLCDWQTETNYDDMTAEKCKIYYYWVKAKTKNYNGYERTTDYSSCDSGWILGEYTLSISSTEGGSVTLPGEGTFLYTGCDTKVAVTAIAEPNYYFVNWSGTAVQEGKVMDCTSASTTVVVDNDYTLKANFITDANTIYVDDDGPADFNNIQAAVDYANNGDTVLVADGIYTGNGNRDIDLTGKTIIVKSQNGPENCIIDCQGTEDEYYFGFDIQDGNSIVKGFTIMNARLSAISCFDAEPSIIGCVLTSNYNNGIYCENTNPIIADCVITSNRGSGIYSRNSNPFILRCQIGNNHSQEYGGGVRGGVRNRNSKPWDSTLTLRNCTINGNSCAYQGGGIYCSSSVINIFNCTISNNRAAYGGGGIFFQRSNNCNGRISNSIILDNSASSGNNLYISDCINVTGCHDSIVNVTYSIIGNEPNSIAEPYYIDYTTGKWKSFDPLFVNPGYWDLNNTPDDANDDFWIEGDYHLKSQIGRWEPITQTWAIDDVTSPCIDTGDPNGPIGLEPLPNGGRINMGAYGGTAQASLSPPWHLHPLSKATNPNPSDGAAQIDAREEHVLSWTPGSGAVLHDVYFGSDFNEVRDANIINPIDALVSFGQDSNFYHPGQLEPNQAYYWRIDEVNEGSYTAIGNMWTFSTDPVFTDAYNPYPVQSAIDIQTDVILTWSATFDAVKHNVYFGSNFDDVNNASITNSLNVLVSVEQEPNFYEPCVLEFDQLYFWRIDEIDANGIITKGNVWTFVTVPAPPKSRCFTGQTPVWIDGIAVMISKVRAGQYIDEINKLEQVQIHEGTFTLYDISLESGDIITVADEHYFMSESGKWISSKRIKAGMRLRTANGLIKVKSIIKKSEPFTGKVYNLDVEGSDRYTVGRDAVIVRAY
jgi:hypothetical protein